MPTKKYYHVRAKVDRSYETWDAIVNDYSRSKMLREIVIPWKQNQPIHLNGVRIEPSKGKIQIIHTSEEAKHYDVSLPLRSLNRFLGKISDNEFEQEDLKAKHQLFGSLLATDCTDELLSSAIKNTKIRNHIPNTAELRKMLACILKPSSEFDAFCLDNFSRVFDRFGSSMDTTEKMNILLSMEKTEDIYQKLKENYPTEVEKYGRKL